MGGGGGGGGLGACPPRNEEIAAQRLNLVGFGSY